MTYYCDGSSQVWKKLSKALTSPLNCLSFHGRKNKNKNTVFSPLSWEARSPAGCHAGPHWRTVLPWETDPASFIRKGKLTCLWWCMGSTRACVPRDTGVWLLFRLCLEAWVPLRTSYGSWGHKYTVSCVVTSPVVRCRVCRFTCCSVKQDPLWPSLSYILWFAWHIRKWLKKNCHQAFVESDVSPGMLAPLLPF